MIKFSHHLDWSVPVMVAYLALNVDSDEYQQYIYAHLEPDQASEFLGFVLKCGNMSLPLIDVQSRDALEMLIKRQTEEFVEYLNGTGTEILNQLKPIDVSTPEFLLGLLDISSRFVRDMPNIRTEWLSERHHQLLVISTEDKEAFETLVRDALSTAMTVNQLAGISHQAGEYYLSAQMILGAIARILFGDEFQSSLSLLIESFYENITKLTRAVNWGIVGSYVPTEDISEEQDWAIMGYGKGRFEGETDEDIEESIGRLQRLRDE